MFTAGDFTFHSCREWEATNSDEYADGTCGFEGSMQTRQEGACSTQGAVGKCEVVARDTDGTVLLRTRSVFYPSTNTDLAMLKQQCAAGQGTWLDL